MRKGRLILCALAGICAASSQAAIYNYFDWTSHAVGDAGSASGNVGGITISYSGDVASPTQTGGGGTNYWIPSAPYISGTVSNAPGTTDIITLDSSSLSNTITFSQAVTNPIMHLVSVGRTNAPVSYTFDKAFTILSQGTGFWGGGATSFTQAGNVLTGREAHGTIMLHGTFTSFSFDVSPSEFWHGFTIGLDSNPAAVPEPFTMALAGMAAAAGIRRIGKKKKLA